MTTEELLARADALTLSTPLRVVYELARDLAAALRDSYKKEWADDQFDRWRKRAERAKEAAVAHGDCEGIEGTLKAALAHEKAARFGQVRGLEDAYTLQGRELAEAQAALVKARWALGSIRDNVTDVQAVGAAEFAGAFLAGSACTFVPSSEEHRGDACALCHQPKSTHHLS